jgi:hypothetical protein
MQKFVQTPGLLVMLDERMRATARSLPTDGRCPTIPNRQAGVFIRQVGRRHAVVDSIGFRDGCGSTPRQPDDRGR